MQYTLESVCQKLHDHDYKVTPQRRIILNVFMDRANEHLSAEEVYNLVKGQHPEIGLATVYRTIDLLAELEVLERMNFDDGKSRYEISNRELHHHHHLICLRCGHVTEFDDDLLESLEAIIAKKSGFQVEDHQLKFYGCCRRCQQPGQ